MEQHAGRLRHALERLEAALTETGYPIAEGLRPGLSEDAIRSRLANIDVDPPQDLITLFGWHDGYDTPANGTYHGWLCPAFEIITLDEACARHAYHQDDLASRLRYSDGQSEWFPLLRADAASCVINYSDDPATRGRIAICDAGVVEPVPEKRPDSLIEPVEMWLSYFDAGWWRWDGSRWIDDCDVQHAAEHPWDI